MPLFIPLSISPTPKATRIRFVAIWRQIASELLLLMTENVARKITTNQEDTTLIRSTCLANTKASPAKIADITDMEPVCSQFASISSSHGCSKLKNISTAKANRKHQSPRSAPQSCPDTDSLLFNLCPMVQTRQNNTELTTICSA